jgi:hypothetical protein
MDGVRNELEIVPGKEAEAAVDEKDDERPT